MIRLEPVLEFDDFTFLHLSGDLSPTDLNAFLRHWAEYNQGGELTLKLPLRDIPALVAQVRTDLLGLLALVEAHAGPEYAAVLDRDLHITDPLP